MDPLAKVLIVDDDPLVLSLLEGLLEAICQIFKASTGTEALDLLNKEKDFAVILCDLYLPDISGIEVLKSSLENSPETIRIIMTACGDIKAAVEVINVGQIAQFILKPWDNASLVQTVANAIEKHQLIHENQRLYDLITKQHKALSKANEAMVHELRLGAKIHKSLLLGNIPEFEGLSIAALTIPSREIDGDFLDFYPHQNQILDLVLADVMGKGIAAALLGAAIKTQLTRFALPFQQSQTYDKKHAWHEEILSPAEVIENVHKTIGKELIQLDYFACLFFGRFDLHKRIFSFVDCGFPGFLQLASGKIKKLKGNSFPIGILEETKFECHESMFNADDLFVFFSDGLNEARSPEKEFYGIARLEELVKKNHLLEPKKIIELIRKDVLDFSNKDYFEDDFTIIIIRVLDSRPLEKNIKNAKFISSFSELKDVRQFINNLCLGNLRCTEKFIYELQLAINEAFCNIVEHAYNSEPNHEIFIKAELAEDGIFVSFSDDGYGFNPSEFNDVDFSGEKEEGFGLHLIKQLSDKIQYRPKTINTKWNNLCIFKNYIKKESMDITHNVEKGILIISLNGDSLDANDVSNFKEKVQDLIKEKNISNVIFDLNYLKFIDSSGLGSFISILRGLRSKGGNLKLVNMAPTIRNMFELVCMDKIFEIYPSNKEALKSFSK